MNEYENEKMNLKGKGLLLHAPCFSSHNPGSCPHSRDSPLAPRCSQTHPHILEYGFVKTPMKLVDI